MACIFIIISMVKRPFLCRKSAFSEPNMGTIWVLFQNTPNFFARKEPLIAENKKNSSPFGEEFMVDDTRLELVTSRTSSGCATSCANRPFLFSKGYFNPSGYKCQAFSFIETGIHGIQNGFQSGAPLCGGSPPETGKEPAERALSLCMFT